MKKKDTFSLTREQAFLLRERLKGHTSDEQLAITREFIRVNLEYKFQIQHRHVIQVLKQAFKY